ncbi:hypothetical protein EVG20_g4293, partial [Dentipellis fragilis]
MDTPEPSTTTFDDEETLADPSATPGIPKDDQLRALAVSIYQRVWAEFYAWGQHDALQALDPLTRPYTTDPPRPLHSRSSAQYLDDIVDSDDDLPLDNPTDLITVIPMHTKAALRVPIRDTQTQTSIQPHPPYESCTPTETCISRHPDDPAASDKLQFIPYADDPTFDYLRKMPKNWYTGFAWQHEQKDPDVELIRLETLRRLYYGQALSIDVIDRLRLLPKARSGNEAGLLWDTMQRDLTVWPGAALSDLSPDPHPNISFTPKADALKGRVGSLLPLFCGNLSCIHAYCPVHVGPHPKPDTRKAYTKSSGLQTRDGRHPCNASCFLRIQKSQNDIDVMVTEWEDSEIADLCAMLGIIPDESPCNLAIICQKPCYEVYYYRCQFFPDENILETYRDRHERNRIVNIDFVDSIGPERHLTYAHRIPPPVNTRICTHARRHRILNSQGEDGTRAASRVTTGTSYPSSSSPHGLIPSLASTSARHPLARTRTRTTISPASAPITVSWVDSPFRVRKRTRRRLWNPARVLTRPLVAVSHVPLTTVSDVRMPTLRRLSPALPPGAISHLLRGPGACAWPPAVVYRMHAHSLTSLARTHTRRRLSRASPPTIVSRVRKPTGRRIPSRAQPGA